MALWTFWLILAVGLLIAELFTQSLTCLYVGIGALCAMGIAIAGGQWVASTVTFVVATAVIYFATIKWRNKLLKRLHAPHHDALSGMDALKGRSGTVMITDRPRIKIDGDLWQIKAANSKVALSDGAQVRVVGYDSAILIVEPE